MADLLQQTVEIVSAYVANNAVPIDGLDKLIRSVHTTLRTVNDGGNIVKSTTAVLEPAVPIKKSVFPNYIICLEDGKKVTLLRRHLKTFNMTPEEYLNRWNLPKNYPMIAPNYSAARSGIAKKHNLGGKRGKASAEAME